MNQLAVYPIHLLPGRVRLQVPGLQGNPARVRELVDRLKQTAGIRQATASFWTGRVLIYYDPAIFQVPGLIYLLTQPECGSSRQASPAPPREAGNGQLIGVEPGRELAATASEPDWYRLSATEVLARLVVLPEQGLTDQELRRRQQIFGANILAGPRRVSPWELFKQQFQDLMVREGMVVGDQLKDLKANWQLEWQKIVAEARNVRNVTEDIKIAAADIKATAEKIKEISEVD